MNPDTSLGNWPTVCTIIAVIWYGLELILILAGLYAAFWLWGQ